MPTSSVPEYEGGSDAELDAKMLADLRAYRDRRVYGSPLVDRELVTITMGELNLMLRVAAERDALRREVIGDDDAPRPMLFADVVMPDDVPFTADVPAEIRERLEPDERSMHSEAECRHEAWEEIGLSRKCADCHVVLPGIRCASVSTRWAVTCDLPAGHPGECMDEHGVRLWRR